MRAAIDHVHHRHRQHLGVGTAEVFVERLPQLNRRGFGHSHGNAEDRIRSNHFFRARAIEVAHDFVNRRLMGGVNAAQCRCQAIVDVFHRLQNAFAKVAALVAIAQLTGLVFTG